MISSACVYAGRVKVSGMEGRQVSWSYLHLPDWLSDESSSSSEVSHLSFSTREEHSCLFFLERDILNVESTARRICAVNDSYIKQLYEHMHLLIKNVFNLLRRDLLFHIKIWGFYLEQCWKSLELWKSI